MQVCLVEPVKCNILETVKCNITTHNYTVVYMTYIYQPC